MRRLRDVPTRFPRTVIAIWLVLFAGGGVLAVNLDPALSGGGFTNPRAEALLTQDLVEERFGESPNQLVVVLDSDTPVSDDAIAATTRVLKNAGADALTTPETNSTLVSADGLTAAVIAGFGGDGTTVQNLVPGLQERLDESGLADDVYVTGQPALDFQLNAHSKADAMRAELIVFPLLIIVLLVVFRTLIATLLPLLVAGSSLVMALGVGYLLTLVTEVSNLYTNIVSMIGLAVAVDYSLFIIKRFREELAFGRPSPAAVRAAMTTAGHSVLFSGIAVILALAALLVPQVMALTSIALGGIVVSVIALLITMLVLPAALTLVGPAIDRFRVPLPRRDTIRVDLPARTRIRRPALVGMIGILALAACALPISGLSLQSPVASATVLPASDPARQGLETLDESIGHDGLFPVDVVIALPEDLGIPAALSEIQHATTWISDRQGAAAVTSVTTLGLPMEELGSVLDEADAPADLERLWDVRDGLITARLLATTTEGPDSVSAHSLVDDIRQDLPASLDPDAVVSVTGATAQGVDFDATIVRSIPSIAALVLLLTFVMLAFAWRSLVLPALALLFNLLVVGASVGALALIQQAISDARLNSVTPILLFAVMFGLSMDYMVIIMSRMREMYRNGAPYEQAVLGGARRTRSMINSAALIMIAVFLSFMTAQISIVREIGIGLAIAVALDAIIIRLIVMPSVLRGIGPRAFGRPPRDSGRAGTTTGAAAETARSDGELVGT